MDTLSYYELAMKTYQHLDVFYDTAEKIDWYNSFAVECHQIVEKLLKAIIECSASVSEDTQAAMKSHDLGNLARRVNRKFPNSVSTEKCAWLSDFYFDTRYPGDNFFVVTKIEAADLLKVTTELADNLIVLYKGLPSLKSFFNEE